MTLQFFVHLNVRKVKSDNLYHIDIGYSRKAKRAKKYGDCLIKIDNVASCTEDGLMGTIGQLEEIYVVQNIVELNLSETEKEKLRNL